MQTKYFILSAELSTRNEKANRLATDELERLLRDTYGLEVMAVEGCYQGVKETAFMVSVPQGEYERTKRSLKLIGQFFGQESILEIAVDKQGKAHAWLLFLKDSSERFIGQFKRLTFEETFNEEAFTRMPATNVFFTFKEQ